MKVNLRNRAGLTRAIGGTTLLLICFAPARSHAQQATPPPTPAPSTTAAVLAAATATDWRPLDPENTLYLELASGRVVIELAPSYAPAHAANVKALVREGYFDGLTINRAQDNYVVQWGDANADDPAKRREVRHAKRSLPAEFDRAMGPDVPFTPSPDGDVYASDTGWSVGFPAARDPKSGRTWLTHCYGTLGAGRGNEVRRRAVAGLNSSWSLAISQGHRTAVDIAARHGAARFLREAGTARPDPLDSHRRRRTGRVDCSVAGDLLPRPVCAKRARGPGARTLLSMETAHPIT